MEPPYPSLQGEPLPGGGATHQPQGKFSAVEQAKETGELIEPRLQLRFENFRNKELNFICNTPFTLSLEKNYE